MKRSLVYGSLLTGLCLALAVVTLALAGCTSLAGLNIVNPRYSIRDIRPHVDIAIPLSASAIDFDFNLGVDNPNRVGLKLDRVDFNLLINDRQILQGFSDQRITVPAQGYGDVRLRARMGYESARSIFREVAEIIQGNRARYAIEGNAYYDTPVGRVKFPVSVFSTDPRR